MTFAFTSTTDVVDRRTLAASLVMKPRIWPCWRARNFGRRYPGGVGELLLCLCRLYLFVSLGVLVSYLTVRICSDVNASVDTGVTGVAFVVFWLADVVKYFVMFELRLNWLS